MAGLLLPTQLVFNIGFYAVVPFLALVMTDDLGLGAAAVGIVLGARTFSQQGMFLFGGVIADRWGARRSILVGCIIRALGYLGLAVADNFWLFLLSAILTGIGGAFFSPALEGLIGTIDRARARKAAALAGKRPPRRTLFAWLVFFGEIGAVTGPLVGVALQGYGFNVIAGGAAALFLAVGIILWLLLPRHAAEAVHGSRPEPAAPKPAATHDRSPALAAFACLRDRSFVMFAVLFSVNLLAYNQLYFALPLELGQDGAGTGTLAALFTLASVLTIALQLPLSALVASIGPAPALRAGFACTGLGFVAVALLGSTGLHLAPGLPVLTGPVVFVVMLSLGHMLVRPVGLQQVHHFAGSRPLSAYYGLLASCGGVAVLLGNIITGALRDIAGGASGWLLLALLAGVSAAVMPHRLPKHAAGDQHAAALTSDPDLQA